MIRQPLTGGGEKFNCSGEKIINIDLIETRIDGIIAKLALSKRIK